MSDLTSFANRMQRVASGQVTKAVVMKAGMAAKEAALDAASDALGGDRAFSGMRRKARLNAGFDAKGDHQVQLNLRPAGLWSLAESGRKASGAIFPRAGTRKGLGTTPGRAVMTPHGPRARSSYGPSRGQKAVTNAWKQAAKDAPKAAAKQFSAEVRKLVR